MIAVADRTMFRQRTSEPVLGTGEPQQGNSWRTGKTQVVLWGGLKADVRCLKNQSKVADRRRQRCGQNTSSFKK